MQLFVSESRRGKIHGLSLQLQPICNRDQESGAGPKNFIIEYDIHHIIKISSPGERLDQETDPIFIATNPFAQ